MHLHPAAQKIRQLFHLEHSCGFLRMLKIETGNNESYWVPEELHYGIPLCDLKLNNEVCKKIVQKKLFSEENLTIHSRESRTLSMKLLDFISTHHHQSSTVDDSELELDFET